jgi:hypothetical protein
MINRDLESVGTRADVPIGYRRTMGIVLTARHLRGCRQHGSDRSGWGDLTWVAPQRFCIAGSGRTTSSYATVRALVFANVPTEVKIYLDSQQVNAKDQKFDPDGQMDIEDELREHLRATGKTPSVIGAEAGVDYSQIYRFLNGQTQLRSGTVAKLCNWAGLTLINRSESASPSMQQRSTKSGRQAPRPDQYQDERRRLEERAWELAVEIVAKMAGKTAEEMKRGYPV